MARRAAGAPADCVGPFVEQSPQGTRMSRAALEAEYRPSWDLVQRAGLRALNCGYLANPADGFHAHQQSLVWRMLAHTPIGPHTVVLDVGCGIGGPATWIWERHGPRQLVGLDYCGSSVRTANTLWAERDPRPQFVQADAHHLPIQNASMDVVFNCESALHYRDKPAFLRECRRVLKPGGHLCLADITAPSPWAWALLLRGARPRTYLWSAKQYRRGLADAGFEVLAYEEASDRVAAALRAGLAEVRPEPGPGAADQRRRAFFLRTLAFLLRRKALTYDLFTAQAR